MIIGALAGQIVVHVARRCEINIVVKIPQLTNNRVAGAFVRMIASLLWYRILVTRSNGRDRERSHRTVGYGEFRQFRQFWRDFRQIDREVMNCA